VCCEAALDEALQTIQHSQKIPDSAPFTGDCLLQVTGFYAFWGSPITLSPHPQVDIFTPKKSKICSQKSLIKDVSLWES